MSALSILQLSRIFELDRVRDEVTKNPDFVNTARLKTVLGALDAIGHTPLISVTEADYLMQTAGVGLLSEHFRPTETRQYDTDFGVISTFIDLTSDLVTDDKVHAFLRKLNQRGAQSLCSDLTELRGGAGRSSKRKQMRDYHVGIWHFLDLALDLSDFLANAKHKAFEKPILGCLLPWFVPEVELFYRSVGEVVEETSFATTAVEQGKEQISLVWKSADAKLGAVRNLFQRVHQGQQPTRDSVPASRTPAGDRRRRRRHPAAAGARRTPGAPVSMVSEELLRVAGRLSVVDAQRMKLADQLNELEVAERVLARFGRNADTAAARQRGRPARTAPAPAAGRRRARGGTSARSVSLSDATLQAVKAHPQGATANEILNHLSREFGMAVRPNHLGIALQRHRRAGRLENRDRRWVLPYSEEEFEHSALIA